MPFLAGDSLSPVPEYDAPAPATGDGGGVNPSAPATPSSSSNSSGGSGVNTAPSVASQVSGVGTADFSVVMAVGGGTPINGPNRFVLPDETVEITPFPSNTVACFVSANTPEMAKFGPSRIFLAPTALPRPVAVKSLNELWLYSTVTGEGIIIEVRKRAR